MEVSDIFFLMDVEVLSHFYGLHDVYSSSLLIIVYAFASRSYAWGVSCTETQTGFSLPYLMVDGEFAMQ